MNKHLLFVYFSSKYKTYWKIAFWFIFVLLVVLTLSPSSAKPINLPHMDKLYHLIAFSGFTFALRVGYRRFTNLQIILASILIGALIEIIQWFIPNRGMSFGDLVADTAGVLLGITIARVFIAGKRRA